MVLGTLLSATGLCINGLAYNRDGYSDNVQMKQTQTYQEKNYFITWVAAVREEVRDIMTIFVGRMSNYNVVSTLNAAIVAGAICEGELTDSCPDFVAHSFYLSMYVSGMYLFMAVMYATRGISVAYKSGMAFLVAVVPDAHDPYDHDYMQQVTRNFEREPWQVLRPPAYELFATAAYSVLARVAGRPQAEHRPREDLVERLPRGGAGPPSWVAEVAASAAGLRRGSRAGLRDLSDESYYQSLCVYSQLWEPYAVAAEESLVNGVLCLAHGAIYFCLGRLYDRSERWAALTILSMFVLLAVVMFSDGACSSFNRDASAGTSSVRAEEDLAKGRCWPYGRHSEAPCQVGVLGLMVAGPLACALADRASVPLLDVIFVPLSYLCHVLLWALFSMQSLRCPRLCAQPPSPPSSEDSAELGGASGVVLPTTPKSREAEVAIVEEREKPEALLRELLHRSREEIRANLATIKASTGLVHAIAACAWLSIFLWSLWQVHSAATSWLPVVQTHDIPVRWPRGHFKPRALACVQDHIFLADRFGVFELADGALHAVPCELKESVADITAACEGQRCWPVVLSNGSREVTDCASNTTLPLLPAPTAEAHLASASRERVAVLYGGELIEYVLTSGRQAFRPLGSLADVVEDGLRSVELRDGGYLSVFREVDGDFSRLRQIGNHAAMAEVDAISSSLPGFQPLHFAVRLPDGLPPMRGGCVAKNGTSMLVLLQGSKSSPRIVELRVNASTGTLL